MFNKNNSRQQFWDKITLKLVSAVNKPLSINTHTHTHDLTLHTLNCVHPGPGLIFRCWLAVRGAQRAVRGKELGDRLSWAELWEGDRQRETDRQADGGKVAIWVDRPQGHMVESQAGWCSAAPCLRVQPHNLMRLRRGGGGRSWWSAEQKIILYSFCWFWLVWTNLLFFLFR